MFNPACPISGGFSRFILHTAHPRCSAAAALLLSACAGDVVDVGENVPFPASAQCSASGTVRGSVVVQNQEQLNELAGCEVIEGNLDIVPFRDADLRALHALVRVDGDVVIGSHIADPPRATDSNGLFDSQANDLLHREQQRARGPQWLATLDGLERLEVVGSLTIEAPIESLEALSGLRRVTTGRLALLASELNDLKGLEGLRDVTALHIVGADGINARLQDMTALHLPTSMQSLDVAASVEALDVSDVRSISQLSLVGVFLEDLDMFRGLLRAETIEIADCPFLRDMDGLNGVTGMKRFSASGNLSLQRLPESLNSAERLDSFIVASNPSLESLPELTMLEAITSFEVNYEFFGGGPVLALPTFPRMNLEGAAPVHLERIIVIGTGAPSFVMPRAWKSAEWVQIMSNYELRDLDFGGLETVGRLAVERNAELTTVTLGPLEWVPELYTDVPELDELDGVDNF